MKKIVYLISIFFVSFIFVNDVYAAEAKCVYKEFNSLGEHLEITFDQKTGKKFDISCYDRDGYDCSSNYNISKLNDKNSFKVSEPDDNVVYECLTSIYYSNISNVFDFSSTASGSSNELKLNTSSSKYTKSTATKKSGDAINCSYKVTSAGAESNATFVFSFTKDFKKFDYKMTGNAGKSFDLRPDVSSFKEAFKKQYDSKKDCPNVYTVFYDYANRYTASMNKDNLDDGSKTTNDNINNTPATKKGNSDISDLSDKSWSNEEGCTALKNGKTIEILRQILNYLQLAAVALLLVLGSLDFAGAVMSDKDDAMKQAGNKFIKRLIASVIVFLVPVLVNIVLFIADKSESVCGLLG